MKLLVLDIGSSSIRALLFDEPARLIPDAHTTILHQFTTDADGMAVTNADQLRAYIEACIDHIISLFQPGEIVAVGLTTFVGNLLGVSADNRPLTPVYTYADTRSRDDLAALAQAVDPAAQHQVTGCRLHPAYYPAQLHWLRRTDPQVFNRVHQWIDIGTYCFRRWFGDSAVSPSVASWTGLLNRTSTIWDATWLKVLGIDAAHLARIADTPFIQESLNPEYAERWNALQHIPFFYAIGDGAAANIGSGCVDESKLALTMGTTAALRTVMMGDPPPIAPGLWSYRIDRDHHLIGGATTEGGSIYQWMRDTLQFSQSTDVEADLLNRQPDRHGLTMLPHFAGERSPGWRADASGAIIGLRLSTTPLDLLQAGMESVALRLSLIAEQLNSVTDASTVIAGGGALTSSRAWVQMIADALDRPIHLTQETETTARGMAIYMLHALTGSPLDAYPPQISGVIEPRPYAVEVMRRARERQTDLYRRLYGDLIT